MAQNEHFVLAEMEMGPRVQEAILRVNPFPTLIAQAVQLVDLAGGAGPGTVQALAKAALVFAAMSLECAATSCLELARMPRGPHGKLDRALSVLDKFDLLHWIAVRAPLDRGMQLVQKVDDLVSARNGLVHARVRRQAFGAPRAYAVGEGVDVAGDETTWNALQIPKDERRWNGKDAMHACSCAVGFLNYFFFEACRMEERRVAEMLCTSSGDAVFLTPWESEVLSAAEQKFGFSLRFIGLPRLKSL